MQWLHGKYFSYFKILNVFNKETLNSLQTSSEMSYIKYHYKLEHFPSTPYLFKTNKNNNKTSNTSTKWEEITRQENYCQIQIYKSIKYQLEYDYEWKCIMKYKESLSITGNMFKAAAVPRNIDQTTHFTQKASSCVLYIWNYPYLQVYSFE